MLASHGTDTDPTAILVRRMDVEELILRGATPSERRSFLRPDRNSSNIARKCRRLNGGERIGPNCPAWISVLHGIRECLRRSRTQARAHFTIAENLAEPVVCQAWRTLGKILDAHHALALAPAAKNALRKALSARLNFTATRAADWMWKMLHANAAILIGPSVD